MCVIYDIRLTLYSCIISTYNIDMYVYTIYIYMYIHIYICIYIYIYIQLERIIFTCNCMILTVAGMYNDLAVDCN